MFDSKDPFARAEDLDSEDAGGAGGDSSGGSGGGSLAEGGASLSGGAASASGSPLGSDAGGSSGLGAAASPLGGDPASGGGVPSPSGGGTAVCRDFSTQAEAQSAANTLDADGDGTYCEALPCPCARPGSSSPDSETRTRTKFTYVADVKLGPTDKERTLKDIEAPKLLPTDERPLIVFLGAANDGKSALFMIDNSKLTSTGGKGECKPDPVTCSFLTLSTDGENDLHLFEDSDGARYSLRLLDISAKTLERSSSTETTSPPATGARARDRRAGGYKPFALPDFGRLFSR